jgi:hypothetical protein
MFNMGFIGYKSIEQYTGNQWDPEYSSIELENKCKTLNNGM